MRPALLEMTDKTGRSTKDFVTLVHQHLVSEPTRVTMPNYPCGWCSEDLRVTCSCMTARRLKMSHEGGQPQHKLTTNSKAQVPTKRAESSQGRAHERNVRPRASISEEERKYLLLKKLCFHCKEPWSRDHQCKGKALQAAMIPEILDAESREDDHWDSMDRALMGATVSQNLNQVAIFD